MVKIRPYRSEDLENTVQLWYQTWHRTFSKLQHPQPYPTWKARFSEDLVVRGEVWVAEVGNQMVGFMVVIRKEQYLDQLFVDVAYQNQGIGSALLAKAKGICPQRLTLHTLQQNTQACAFYERHGFKAGQLITNPINGQPSVEYHWIP